MTTHIEIGHNHTIKFVYGKGDEGRLGLYYWHHRLDNGKPCQGFIFFDLPVVHEKYKAAESTPVWQVESWDPLTLSPSLLCRRCGDHGFIRGGSWVPA